jgi:hypothetical protein
MRMGMDEDGMEWRWGRDGIGWRMREKEKKKEEDQAGQARHD